MFVLEVIFWIIFIYGFFSLAQDILNEITYKKINHNMKIVILTKVLENNLESFINEFDILKKYTINKNVTLINLTESDDFNYISRELEKEKINWRFFDIIEGKKIIEKYMEK